MVPTTPGGTVADIYLRFSDMRTDDLNDDGKGKGLVEHERVLTEFLARLGWVRGQVIVENDMTGGKPKPASAYKRKKVTMPDGSTVLRVIRPGFRRLLDRLASGQSSGFVTVDLDRAMRDPRDLEDLIDIVHQRRANVRSMTGSLQFTDGGTDSEITLARVMVTMANKASRDTARRVSAARQRQARNGEYGGGPRPYGFEADGVTVIPAEAKAVLGMAEAVMVDIELRAIARDLNARGVVSARGGQWSARTVRDVLLRPRNAGLMVYDDKEVEGISAPWEPIVPVDLWRSVMTRLKDPARVTTPGPAPRWLGSGIYSCGAEVDGAPCGASLYVYETAGPAKYRCKMPATHVVRILDKVDALVQRKVIARLSGKQALKLLDMPADKDGSVDIGALRAEAKTLRERKDNLAADYASGIIDRAQLAAGTRTIEVLLDKAQARLTGATEVSVVSSLPVGASREIVAEAWLDLSLGVKRAIIKKLVTVVVLPAGRGTRFDPSCVVVRPRPA